MADFEKCLARYGRKPASNVNTLVLHTPESGHPLTQPFQTLPNENGAKNLLPLPTAMT